MGSLKNNLDVFYWYVGFMLLSYFKGEDEDSNQGSDYIAIFLCFISDFFGQHLKIWNVPLMETLYLHLSEYFDTNYVKKESQTLKITKFNVGRT